MDPHNGEMLAMAVTPRMDLNQFRNYGTFYDNASQFNRAIAMPYEPGSVVKILPWPPPWIAAQSRPDTTYLDTGAIVWVAITIQNWNQEPWGVQDMTGCLQHSFNVCMASISTQMGAENFL